MRRERLTQVTIFIITISAFLLITTLSAQMPAWKPVTTEGLKQFSAFYHLQPVLVRGNLFKTNNRLILQAETTEILETSRLVSKLTGYPVQFNKAVVGKNAFSHESGIHQHGYLRNKMTYEIMTPDSVGQEAKIILGKHSGRAGFKDALDKLSIELDEESFNSSFETFKKLADRKGEIVENELRAIVGQVETIK